MKNHPIYSNYPSQLVDEILNQDFCEIDSEFPGFVETYKGLSKTIPFPEKTIILDFGCYLASQSCYFTNFKKYIGIDVITLKRFKCSNTEHYIMKIEDWINTFAHDIKQKHNVFAICNFVSLEMCKLVSSTFISHYTYYPEQTTDTPVILNWRGGTEELCMI